MISNTTLYDLIERAVEKAIAKLHDKMRLGKGDTAKTLFVAGRANFVWARDITGSNALLQVRCTKITPAYGLEVYVKRGLDGVVEVAGQDDQSAEKFWGGKVVGNGGAHALAHGYFGTDPILLVGRQFVPFLCQANDPADLTVRVHPCIFWNTDGSATAFAGGNLDLSSYVPSSANQQRIVIVARDKTTNTLTAIAGTPKTVASTDVTRVPFSDAEAAAIALGSNHVPSMAVRLYNGQTVINIHDTFLDMRQYYTMPWEGGSGSGAESGEAQGICQCRLTTVSGTPVPTGNNSPSSTLYLTEFRGQLIELYNTTSETWEPHYLTSEVSISLSGTASLYGYDVLVYDDNGTLTLEIVSWGSGTSRSTALGTQDGHLVKASDHSHLFLGSIMIDSGGGTCTQDESKMGVDNHYNKRPYKMKVQEGATYWTYGSATKRGFNGSANARFYIINNGYDKHKISLEGRCWGRSNSGTISMAIGIGKDSTTINVADSFGNFHDATVGGNLLTELEDNPSDGVHFYQLLEWTNGSTGYFSGNAGVSNDIRQTFKATAWG